MTLCGPQSLVSNLALSNGFAIHFCTFCLFQNHLTKILFCQCVLLCKLSLSLFLFICLYHFSNLKNRNPRVFSPGVLWSVVVYFYTTVLRDPWQISGVRSYDRLPHSTDNQLEATKPACLGIALNCWCLLNDCILFLFKTFVYIDSTIAVYVLIIQLFSSVVNLFLIFWLKSF